MNQSNDAPGGQASGNIFAPCETAATVRAERPFIVVARAPGTALDPDDIGRALAQELAAFKRPKRIIILKALPRDAMGKVQKANLRARYKDSFSTTSA
jgi:acyl-CoA synthetase (AMP-forming)/AMP-acid ligase II